MLGHDGEPDRNISWNSLWRLRCVPCAARALEVSSTKLTPWIKKVGKLAVANQYRCLDVRRQMH
jgi:hypothetical protein